MAFSGCSKVVSGSELSKTSTLTGTQSLENNSNGRAQLRNSTRLYPFMRSSRGSRSYLAGLTRSPVHSSELTSKHEHARMAAPTLWGYLGSISTTAGVSTSPFPVEIPNADLRGGTGIRTANG